VSGPEASLVAECKAVAEALGAFLACVGQQKAKGSGTTKGYPDGTLLCAGHVELIEFKRPKTDEHSCGYVSLGQSAFIARAAEMGVTVHVVDNVNDFVRILNSCRASRGVQRLASR
jgi:hypothetical protein